MQIEWSKDMRNAPKDGRLLLIDTYPESVSPCAAYWSGKWWMAVAGGWVNHGVRWAPYPTTVKEQS